MKMNVYQKISQIIKEADGILIGASNGLSIAEGYNIFADDAWFQENMGDFREKYGLRCVLHGFSVPMKVEEKWAFVSRLVKAKAMQDEPSEIMKNIYALVKDKEYFVVTSNAEDHFVPAGFEADRVFEMEGKLTQMRCKNRCHDEVYPNQKAVLAMTAKAVIPHAASLHQACAHCAIFPTAASRRSLGTQDMVFQCIIMLVYLVPRVEQNLDSYLPFFIYPGQ